MWYNSPKIAKIAREFWSNSGFDFFPGCDIFRVLTLALPLDIVVLPQLSLLSIEQWFEHRQVHIDIYANDRVLHGFIVTYASSGIIFINDCDCEEERRYTLAHEASHFLLDYKIPRDIAINKLGPGIREVLDGIREPSIQERVDGLLSAVRIGPYMHLIEKQGNGSFVCNKIYEAEQNADMLALELLSPQAMVIREVKKGEHHLDYSGFRTKCLHLLMENFRLPENIASQYSSRLSHIAAGSPSTMRKLGF
jgi:hypothetical protein